MNDGTKPPRKASMDVIVYMVYLASFLVLLVASTTLFGDNPLTLAFGGFVVGAIAIVAAASRSLIY